MNRHQRRAAEARARRGAGGEALKDREHMLDHNTPMIATAVCEAESKGMTDSVVVVADTRDRIGAEVARACGYTDTELDTAQEAYGRIGAHPTITLVVPRAAAVDAMAETHPTISGTLRALGPVAFDPLVVVVAIAAGGASLAMKARATLGAPSPAQGAEA